MVKFDGISKHLQTKRNEILHFFTSFDNIWVYVHRTQIFVRRSECEISATFFYTFKHDVSIAFIDRYQISFYWEVYGTKYIS